MTPTDFADLLYLIATESFRYYWMPLCIWTLLAGGFLLADRWGPTYHPGFKYNLGTVLLWSLPAGILLAFLLPLSVAAPVHFSLLPPPPSGSGLTQAPQVPDGTALTPFGIRHLVGILTMFLLAAGCIRLVRLGLDALQLSKINQSIKSTPLNQAYPELDKKRVAMGIRKEVGIVFSREATVPVTFGLRQPVIVLPHAFKEDPDHTRLTVIHELGHIGQQDYLRRFVERSIQCFFFYHPLVSTLISRIDQYREMHCDSQVLQFGQTSAGQYARFLLSLSTPSGQHASLAIHIADSGSKLKKRILAMKKQHDSTMRSSKTYIGITLLAFIFVASALIVACEMDFAGENRDLEASENLSVEPAPQEGEVFMIVEEMPELIGGLASLQQEIQYPDIAKNAGIEGRVFIQFVVDENGDVQDPVVIRGIGGGCDEEAVRAIQTATFNPGRQNGQPVKVKMSIPFTFQLPE